MKKLFANESAAVSSVTFTPLPSGELSSLHNNKKKRSRDASSSEQARKKAKVLTAQERKRAPAIDSTVDSEDEHDEEDSAVEEGHCDDGECTSSKQRLDIQEKCKSLEEKE